MSPLARRFNRPEFVFRPGTALRRLRLGRNPGTSDSRAVETVNLPWSQTIAVLPDELGHCLKVSGIFDICATETIYRLLDAGGLAVDVGANVGYLTNLMATRVGPTGTVIAFEPHPIVFGVLERNVARWDNDVSVGAVQAHRFAVSSESGTGYLAGGAGLRQNMLATLRGTAENPAADDAEVDLATLDDLLAGRQIQLLKIDVEGHEHSVLESAEALLAADRIMDVVFEDHGVYPTPAMTLLERYGMTVFTLDHSLLGPRVHPVVEGPAPPGWPGPNYLGTLDPKRAMARLRSRGWRSLRTGPRTAVK